MNLKQLAKKYQGILKDGCIHVIIWKEGRSWQATDLCNWSIQAAEDIAIVAEIKEKDPRAIIVHGWNNFAEYSLDYITSQIKHIYDRSVAVEEVATVETYEMMLVHGDELTGGEQVETVEEYYPDDMSIGYDIIRVKAEKLEDITYTTKQGMLYKAYEAEDGVISVWEPLNVDHKELQTFTMMLADGDELTTGELISEVCHYEPSNGDPGYSIIKVKAAKLGDIVRRNSEGVYYQACELDDGIVSSWYNLGDKFYYYQLVPESDPHLGGMWSCCGLFHDERTRRQFYLDYFTKYDTRGSYSTEHYEHDTSMKVCVVPRHRGHVAGRDGDPILEDEMIIKYNFGG